MTGWRGASSAAGTKRRARSPGFPRTSAAPIRRSRWCWRGRRGCDGSPVTGRTAIALLALAGAAGAASPAAVLHLKSGGAVAVSSYWIEGDTVFYEGPGGVVGLPRSEVARIDDDAPGPPPGRRSPAAPRPEARPSPPDRGSQDRWSDEELEQAIARLEEERRRAGIAEQRRRIDEGLANLHVLLARRHAERGELDAAEDEYERALGLLPRHRVARVELGWLELRAGRSRRAEAVVETGLAADPDDPWLLELRGEILYRANRLEDALEDLRAALRKRPGDAGLRARLEKVRRDLSAERGYRRTLSRHFEVRYDGDRDDAAGELLVEVLEDAWDELTRELEVYPTEPITVILYTSRQFHETTGTGREVAGLYDGKIRLPAGGIERVTPAVRRVARHELVHALLRAKAAGPLPRWLHEGLAQLLEPRDPDTVRPALARAASEGRLDLEPFSYPASLSFVAFLDSRYSRTRLLWLVERLARGQPEDDAFLGAFGAGREELVDEWRRWLPERS
ncbi:MAG: hypothetical protein D6718_03445 [Acidobacteria bacterium]|nr:MAG: hypothetical protein D6718_03445 [Acidobacteriota bacterium]